MVIAPYGGRLTNLVLSGQERSVAVRDASALDSVVVSDQSLHDVEMLAVGALSPLDSFMGRHDYERVLDDMRLANGVLFPLPITLPATDACMVAGARVALRNTKNEVIAILAITERFECREPQAGERACVTGHLTVVNLPGHYDFAAYRHSPADVRARWDAMGVSRIAAVQMSKPMSDAEQAFLARLGKDPETGLLIQATAGRTNARDVEYYNRIAGYERFISDRCDPARTLLNILPMAERQAGTRESILHAIVQRNYGADCLVVGPSDGPLHRERLSAAASEMGMRVVAIDDVPDPAPAATDIQPGGACVWFTGLSGAGKSTIAEILATLLMERGRQTTLLDGDVVRTHLSRGLGFTREDRDTNVRRIGFVASEIVRHQGIVICAAVSPYRSTRHECRTMVGGDRFVEVFVDTPLDVCERRDVKGMYAKARRGELKGFTGIDDPYESPDNPELRLTTTDVTPQDNARMVLRYLLRRGFVADPSVSRVGTVA